MDYTLNGTVRTRQGNRHDYMAPHNAYPCAGGPMKWVTIAVETDEEWQAMCNVMGNPEWAADKKYADAMGRWEHQEEMDVHIAEWTRQYTNYDVTRMLQEAGVAAFPTLSNRGLTEDPHLNARGFFFEITDHPEPEMQGRKCDGLLWKMSRTPGKIRRRAPMVGEHNRYVFGEFLGMPQSDIDRLVEEKVLF